MKKILNKEQEKYLYKIIPKKTTKQIQDLMYKKYNIEVKIGIIERFKTKNNIKSGLRLNLNKEQEIFLKDILETTSSKEVVKLFYKKFKIKITPCMVNHYRVKFNILRNEHTGQFKKGIKPHNFKKVGYEFIDKEGYIWIKTKDNKFKRKQLAIYEKHYGKIPKGYSVIFLDKNKKNFNINNLMLVKNKDKLTAKNRNLITNDKEMTKLGILTAQLINKNCEIRKETNT